ncbi:MAG: WD40 repeat domain-containing protein, partial [Gammaproteobacteria bacterium]|nr:WD40 repeat domain-containing protein [Gammaproteobacteria bacterium]
LAVLLVSVQCVACTPEPEPVNDIGRWQITDSFILSAALSKQGQHTALLFPQGRLAVWDNDTQKRLVDWHAPDVLPDTSMMHMDESARYLLSATRTVVQIWDATSAAPAGSLDLSAQLGDASITSLRFILAPHSFVIGTSGGDILFADTRSDEYHLAHQHDADVVKLIVSPDGELYSAGNDGLVVRWDKQHKAPEQTLTVPHRVTSLEVGPDDKVFVSDA